MSAAPDSPALFAEPVAVPLEYVATAANEVDRNAPTIPPPGADGVTVVQALNGKYWVSRVRHNGTTYAQAEFTRAELVMLSDALAKVLR